MEVIAAEVCIAPAREAMTCLSRTPYSLEHPADSWYCHRCLAFIPQREYQLIKISVKLFEEVLVEDIRALSRLQTEGVHHRSAVL